MSVILVAMFVIPAGELYAAITVINAVAFLLASFDTSDFLLWFLVFEITVLTAVPFLTMESRSYRKTYSMVVMLILAFASTVAIYAVISSSISSATSISTDVKAVSAMSWTAVLLGLLVILVKVPSWPFSVWLPEAHVEASWGGSVVLAGYALKFATIALLLFGSAKLTVVDPVVTMLCFSVIFSSAAICATMDSKKMVANLSIIHMSATAILLVSSISSLANFLIDLSWHHHSVVTGGIFLLIGWTYAVSGSRIFRFLVSSVANKVIFLAVYFGLLTISLDLPWTPNVMVEISFVAIIAGAGNVLILCSLIVFFCFVIIGFLKMGSGVAKRNGGNLHSGTADVPVTRIAQIAGAVVLVIAIGFGGGNR